MRERVKWVRPINLNDTFRPIVNIAALEKQKKQTKACRSQKYSKMNYSINRTNFLTVHFNHY